MKKWKLLPAAIAVLTLTACGGGESEVWLKSGDDVSIAADDLEVSGGPDISGQTVYWMGIYDLNPKGTQDRSVALTLFEDVYGAKVEYIATTSDTRFDDLTNRINGGDQVDMFPYEWNAVPNGVTKGMYDPLDDYINLDDPVWAGVKDMAEMFKYNGHYYVVPYVTSDPLAVTYSRAMIAEEGLQDPYELYQKGEWNWNTFLDLMKQFVGGGDGSTERVGIRGWFGQAILQSTGDTVVKYDGSKFSNNIMSPAIERAELLQEEISKLGLYDATWYSYFPDDGSTLFYAMAPWALGESNAKNPEEDLFIVPFPKDPEADDYYLNMNYGAIMLVKNSQMGDAVATYIKCCRLEQTEENYREAAREKALIQNVNAQGQVRSYVTAEQYDFMQTWYDTNNIKPVFDFGYGMGSLMDNESYDYSSRGVMNNCADALLIRYEGTPDTWAEIRTQWSSVVDEVVADFNDKMQE